ncbi:MAG: MFS transporter, partial [Cyclobacteriaceae bacterium]
MSSSFFSSTLGNYRWRICALLFFSTTINYVDRQVLGILAPDLQREFQWSESDYGLIVTSFQAAYAIGFFLMGRLMDKVGTRIGYAFALVFWSVAAMLHAAARSAVGFGLARFGLGLGEGGNFPAAVKTTAEWFPRRERSFATGIFNSGTNIGAVVAPLVVPWITIRFGWQSAFIFTGALGLIWLLFWLTMYRRPSEHPDLKPSELAHIQSDQEPELPRIPVMKLLRTRQIWVVALGKFLTDPVWWFFLYWLPKFLHTQHGLTLDRIGLPLVLIYLISDVGSIGGGWLSSWLMARGWSLNRARKTTMMIAALAVTPIYLASQTSSLWMAVALIGLATAAHQAWSANMHTLASDLFPRQAVGSVMGFGGMFGAIAGMFVATAAGFVLEWTGSYVSLFVVAGGAYLVAWTVIQLLSPRLEPVPPSELD